jgi:colanic acid/amylovoran biosynthesis glycosyltransferase
MIDREIRRIVTDRARESMLEMNAAPIKVVHFNKTFGSVTENWIYNQVTGLDGSITRFYAIDRVNKDEFPLNGLRCLREDLTYFPLLFNRAWNKFFHRYPQFLFWLRKDRPHLIHAHFGPSGHYILPYARWLNIPLITSFYGYDAYLMPEKEPCWHDRYKKLFQHGRLFLAEGPAMCKKLIELGCPREKTIVHHIGINLGNYQFSVRKPSNEIRLMVCGRFVEKKGIPYAIEALSRVISRGKANVRLTIVGDSDSDGSMTSEKRRILYTIEKQALASAVRLVGYVPHDKLIDMLYDHHILIAPSVHASDGDAEGGFPIILTEALATGMPVVAFNHCDIPEIVQDGKSGFLVPEKDVDALAERLVHLIDHPEIWPEMGRAGREYVETNFDIDKLNDRLVEIYQELLD